MFLQIVFFSWAASGAIATPSTVMGKRAVGNTKLGNQISGFTLPLNRSSVLGTPALEKRIIDALAFHGSPPLVTGNFDQMVLEKTGMGAMGRMGSSQEDAEAMSSHREPLPEDYHTNPTEQHETMEEVPDMQLILRSGVVPGIPMHLQLNIGETEGFVEDSKNFIFDHPILSGGFLTVVIYCVKGWISGFRIGKGFNDKKEAILKRIRRISGNQLLSTEGNPAGKDVDNPPEETRMAKTSSLGLESIPQGKETV